jgi:haloalkane dehalogenase
MVKRKRRRRAQGARRTETPVDIEPFRHLYPFASRYVAVNGLRMHYVDEGRGEPVVMLHGNPTWSFYFRELITGLSSDCRAIAPDHIGCGLSEKPDSRDYGFSLANRAADLEAFMSRLGIEKNITLVLHDWGGAIGAAYAVRFPERICRLIVMNTAAFRKPAHKPLQPALRLLRALPRAAAPTVLGMNLFARGAAWTASARGLTAEVRRGLMAPYNSWHNRLATLRFVQDIPLAPADPSYGLIQRVEEGLERLSGKPMLILWGEKDFVFDRDYLAEWIRRFPGAEVHRFPAAGHYLLEDAPQAVVSLAADFIARHPVPEPGQETA